MKGNCVFRGEFLYPYIPGLGMVGSLAWLPWHKVPIHLLSLTCRETCCSHSALTYFPNVFPAPLQEPSCRSAGLYTSSYLHLGPASTFPLSEGQRHPHTAFKYPHTYQLKSSILREAMRRPTKVLSPARPRPTFSPR